jgi:hypothetical protein
MLEGCLLYVCRFGNWRGVSRWRERKSAASEFGGGVNGRARVYACRRRGSPWILGRVGRKAEAEKLAFGRAGAPSARLFYGTRERVPFRVVDSG